MVERDPGKSEPQEPVRAGSGAVPPSPVRGVYVRERVLIVCVILLIVLFAFTAFVARQYHRTVHRLGDRWFAEGETLLRQGHTEAAISDYRNALVYKPDDANFQFHLARALARSGREDEARSYLLTLLAESPGSGPINLALARVAVNLTNGPEAIRYYHSAIYGVWETDPLKQRWEVRRELCEYLLNRGQVHEAEPDLIALAQDVPEKDVAREKIAAALLLRGSLWNRALSAYKTVLGVHPRDAAALAGAGTAAFQLAMYSDAASFLERLPREERQNPNIAKNLSLSAEAATMNALRPGLSASERAKRAAKAVNVAEARISSCARQLGQSLLVRGPVTPLRKLYATARNNRRMWSESNLQRHPDQAAAAMSFAFRTEDEASKECGQAQSISDRALSLIAAGRTGLSSE